jgi:hypothetical protein
VRLKTSLGEAEDEGLGGNNAEEHGQGVDRWVGYGGSVGAGW